MISIKSLSIDVLPRISDAAEWIDLLAVVVFVGGRDKSVVIAAEICYLLAVPLVVFVGGQDNSVDTAVAGICCLLTLAVDEVCFFELIRPKMTQMNMI